MSSTIEVLGMVTLQLLKSALSPREKNKNVLMLEKNDKNIIRKDIKPRDIMTREALITITKQPRRF
jgi:dihydroxyacid dehydratase/phosphogluconate dehydratase